MSAAPSPFDTAATPWALAADDPPSKAASPSSSNDFVPPTAYTSLSASPAVGHGFDKMSFDHHPEQPQYQQQSSSAGPSRPDSGISQTPSWQTATVHDPVSLQALLSSTLSGHPQPAAAFPTATSSGTTSHSHHLAQPGWAAATQSLQNDANGQARAGENPYTNPFLAQLSQTSSSGLSASNLQHQLASINNHSSNNHHFNAQSPYNTADHTRANSPQSSVSSRVQPFSQASAGPSAANTPSPGSSSHQSADLSSATKRASLGSLRPTLETINSSSSRVPRSSPSKPSPVSSSGAPATGSSTANQSSLKHQQAFGAIDFKELARDMLHAAPPREQSPDLSSVFSKERSPAPPSPSLSAFGGSTTTAAPLESPDEIQANDPLATQMWKFFAKAQKSKNPNAARMENLSWRMGGMALGQKASQSSSAAPTPSASAADHQEEPEPVRGRKSRSQKSATPPGNRHFSPIPESSNEMDWRPMSRSRSRARPPVSLPYIDTNFGSMPEESAQDATLSPALNNDSNEFFASLFGVPPAKDLNTNMGTPSVHEQQQQQSGFVVDSSNINNWLNPAPSSSAGTSSTVKNSGLPLDADWARFLHGSDSSAQKSTVDPSFVTRSSGSVPGLQHPQSRVENHTTDFGFIPKLVRKTSYDAAYASSVHKSNNAGSKQNLSAAQRQDGFVVPVSACFDSPLPLAKARSNSQPLSLQSSISSTRSPKDFASSVDLAALGRPAPASYSSTSRSPSNLSATLPNGGNLSNMFAASSSSSSSSRPQSSGLSSQSIFPAFASLPSTPSFNHPNATGNSYNFGNFMNASSSFVDPSSLLLSGQSPATSVFPNDDNSSWAMSPSAFSPSSSGFYDARTAPSSPGTVSPSIFPDASSLNSSADLNNNMAFSGGPSRSNSTAKSARKNSTSSGHSRSFSMSSAQPPANPAAAGGQTQGQGAQSASNQPGGDGQLVCSNCSTTVRFFLCEREKKATY